MAAERPVLTGRALIGHRGARRLWADQSFMVWLQIQAQQRCANFKKKKGGRGRRREQGAI